MIRPASQERSKRRGVAGGKGNRWNSRSRPQHSWSVTKTRHAESDTAKIAAINAFAHYLLTKHSGGGFGWLPDLFTVQQAIQFFDQRRKPLRVLLDVNSSDQFLDSPVSVVIVGMALPPAVTAHDFFVRSLPV